MQADRFARTVVVVTGASSGIGEALALRLAGEGAWLALAGRRAERLEALAGVCIEKGGRALALPTDVTDETACRDLVDRAVAEYGRLDMLVNNAGITVGALLTELPDLTLFRRVMDVNFLGGGVLHLLRPLALEAGGRARSERCQPGRGAADSRQHLLHRK